MPREEAYCLVDSPRMSAKARAPVVPDHREAQRNSKQPGLDLLEADPRDGMEAAVCLKLTGLHGLNRVQLC